MGCCSKENKSSLQNVVVSPPNSADLSSRREQREEASGNSSQDDRTFTASQAGNDDGGDHTDMDTEETILDCILPRIQEDSDNVSHAYWAGVYKDSLTSGSAQDALGHVELAYLAGRLGREVRGSLYPFHVLSELGDPQWRSLVFFLRWHPDVREDFMRGLSNAVRDVKDNHIKWERSVKVLKLWQSLLPKIYEKMKAERVR